MLPCSTLLDRMPRLLQDLVPSRQTSMLMIKTWGANRNGKLMTEEKGDENPHENSSVHRLVTIKLRNAFTQYHLLNHYTWRTK